ncbi:hypothetical protein B0H21DRAFT_826145 [Amylocystis lapponica]|nr:hypothetical protein B0H21DRAFT_826145 [Amylocystis lapponica]
MNTPQSMASGLFSPLLEPSSSHVRFAQALGWGSLVLAAGVSYYYAKQSIDERRKSQEVAGSRPVEKLDWRARIAQQEQPGHTNAVPTGTDKANSSALSTASAKTVAANVKDGS